MEAVHLLRWIADHDLPTEEIHIRYRKHTVACDVYLDDSPLVLPELLRHRPDAAVCRMIRPWNAPLDGAIDEFLPRKEAFAEAGVRVAGRVRTGSVEKAFRGPKGVVKLEHDGETITDTYTQQGEITTDNQYAAYGVTADCEVAPAPAAALYHAELVGFTWRVEDSRPAVVHADRPGSEERPAARHVYQTKGRWTVTVDCTWRGGWGEQVTTPCGQRDLDVIEVRARLRSDIESHFSQ